MECSNCGAKNSADANFCQTCGESLEPASSGELTVPTGRIEVEDRVIKDRFRVIRKLGKGGMGEVLLAEDLKLKRKVAVKSILTSSLSDSSSKIRFLREAQTASQLDHPNICTIYEIYEEDEHDYIVMQYVDGITVDYILKVKPLSINKSLDIALQVCNGMIEAHEKGVIHRDLKPGNIMVDKKGGVKVLDFGLAKFRKDRADFKIEADQTNLTEKGIVLGTVSYLSPEQASGKNIDHRTDIFSFGILLYEMLEGKNPFKEEEQIGTLYNVLNKDAEFGNRVPPELQVIARRALAKEKKERYQDFSQMKKDLEEYRRHYSEARKNRKKDGGTEVIDFQEQEDLRREIELQKTSDNEGLGDLVYKIKKFKASTERLSISRRRGVRRMTVFLLLLLLGVAGYWAYQQYFMPIASVVEDDGNKIQFYIYLQPFENETRDKSIPPKVGYLLSQSLNQFKEFKVITREDAVSMLELEEGDTVDPAKLSQRFKVKYTISGRISTTSPFLTIDAVLEPLDGEMKSNPITMTGKGNNSFLVNQVDGLTRRVYSLLFPDNGDAPGDTFKRVSRVYGTDWAMFSDFYNGLINKNLMEIDKARRLLLDAKKLLIARYFLADLYYFEGRRSDALKLISGIISHVDDMADPLKYRVLALHARLNFDFEREIRSLEQLRKEFRFSKEALLELGNAYFHHGNADKALVYYKEALALDRDYSKALNRMGYCYAYLGDHTRSLSAFEDYRTLDQSPNSFDSLADGYFYAGDLVNAQSMKEIALNSDEKGVFWAYLTLADIYIIKAQFDKARGELKKYGKLKHSKEEVAEVLRIQAFIHYCNHGYQDALDTINASLETFDSDFINGNTAEAHWLKALAHLALEDTEEAHLELDWLEKFQNKYKLSRENFLRPYKYYVHLDALMLETEEEYEQAEETFKFLVGMKPRLCYWITYFNYQFFQTEYAAFLLRRQKYLEALEQIDICLQYNRNYIPALWLKADIMEKTDDLARFEIYKRLAEIYGPDQEENYWRKRLNEKIKQ